MPALATAAVGLALLLDGLVGEFPERIHPVAAFGRVVRPFDRSWRHPRGVGVLVALGLPILAAGVASGLIVLSARVHPALAAGLAGLVLFSAVSLRMLVSVAGDVIDRSTADPDRARTAVRSLVGRDAAALSPAELRGAAVESLAENLADGLVAPLSAFVIGAHLSLGVAVGAAAWVKGVNTLDSMLGYESTPVGWASARLDDVVMWLPARLTAVLIAVTALDPGAVWRARAWAADPPSPNSGWPMGTLAAVLDVQLRKPGGYVLNPRGALPSPEEAHRGVRIVGLAGVLAFLAGGVLAW